MSFLDELSKLVSAEKTKQIENKNQKMINDKIKAQENINKKKEEDNAKIFADFRKKYEYGRIDMDNKNFQDVGKISFTQCLQKAYCENVEEGDNICGNDEKFYPYLAWKELETQPTKGSCLLGSQENDTLALNYSGIDYIPVFVTPSKTEGDITADLDIRENKAKNDIISRMKNNIEDVNKQLLYEKNRLELEREAQINNNYTSLKNLDKNILTTTQRIKQNYNSYIINNNLHNILIISAISIFVIFILLISYYVIKRFQ